MNQREHAILESERNSAAEHYFEARPYLQSQHSDRVFDAGFDRGWQAAQAQQPAQATTAQEPTVDDSIAQLVDALKRSKGWLGGYADAVIRDAIDRKHLEETTAQEPDPCPQCRKGGVCRTPQCGRLKLPATHPYRTAAPTKPLSEEQLRKIEDGHNWQTTAGRNAIYRAIEAAHGIKEQA